MVVKSTAGYQGSERQGICCIILILGEATWFAVATLSSEALLYLVSFQSL